MYNKDVMSKIRLLKLGIIKENDSIGESVPL